MSAKTFKFLVNVEVDDEGLSEPDARAAMDEAFLSVWDAIERVSVVTSAGGGFVR